MRTADDRRRDLRRKVGAVEDRREDGCMAAAGWLAASSVACTTRPGGASTSAHAAGSTLTPRLKNYAWRMLPHALGFFPYCAAWAVIINNFFEQVDDLCDNLKDRMPDFVPWIVYGCCAIFSTFTFVQWRLFHFKHHHSRPRTHTLLMVF